MNVPSDLTTGHTPGGAKRPYLGATLLIISGLIVGYVPFGFPLESLPMGWTSSAIGLMFAFLIFLTGLSALIRPGLSTFLGIAAVGFSILSVVSTLGGLIIGSMVGITGGNLLIAWHPPNIQRNRNTLDSDSIGITSGTVDSRQNDAMSVTSGTNATCVRTPESLRKTTNDEGYEENQRRFIWQSDPYARQATKMGKGINDIPKGKPKTDATKNARAAGEEHWDKDQKQRNLTISENSTDCNSSPTSDTKHSHEFSSVHGYTSTYATEPNIGKSSVEARLEDALERVAHGAIVSFPAILFTKGISVATTSVLTNGFSGSSYGLFVLAGKFVSFLRKPTSGLLTGLNRFLPAASGNEQDVFATAVSLLILGIGTVFGAGLFLIAPHLTRAFDYGQQFQLFLRIFAVWFPGSLWLQTINAILRSIEEVEAYNVAFRFVLPSADFVAVIIGTFIFQNFVVVVAGQVLITALITIVLTGWLMWRLEFVPQVRGVDAVQLRRKYVRYSIPLVGRQIIMTFKSAILYVLIAVFLSSIAAGVFAVGTLVSSLVSLPLVLNNQFISPVVADLYEHDDHEALIRLYQVTTRVILVCSTGLAIPLLVHRRTVMQFFGPSFAEYTHLLPVFIFAEFVRSIVGSDSIILIMTDRQRATLWIQFVTGLLFVVVAIPLTMKFGLPGIVTTYLIITLMTNSLEIIALYHLNGYFPFTLLHLKPLLAGLPFLIIVFSGKFVLSGPIAPLIGTFAGLLVYSVILYGLGFTRTERRLGALLFKRYRGTTSQFLY